MITEAVSTQQNKRIHPHKFTLWVAIGSMIMMFAGLTSAYIVKGSLPGWSTVEVPKIFYISTAVLLLSSLTIQMANKAFKERRMQQYRRMVMATLVLGSVFIVMQIVGFNQMLESGVVMRGASGAGQFLYIIFGLHGLHVLGGVIALMVMFARAFSSRSRNYNPVSIEIVGTYWHFVDLLWIYLFVFFLATA
ncbi:MAG: cytochrome c oxidase subunit 3 [Flavitalea sp.]